MKKNFLGFSNGVVEVFVLPGCGAASLGNQFPMLNALRPLHCLGTQGSEAEPHSRRAETKILDTA